MAHNSKVFAVPPTDGVTTFTSAQAVLLDLNGFKAINGDDGGTWAPTAPIIIGGGAAGGFKISGAGSRIMTGAGGRIELGDNDFPTLAAGHSARTRTVMVPCNEIQAISTGSTLKTGSPGPFKNVDSTTLLFAANGTPVQPVTVNTASAQSFAYFVPLRGVHNGATLSTVTWRFTPPGSHAGLPTYQPWVRVFRAALTGSGAPSELASGGATQLAAGSVVAYEVTQSLALTCDQNNVIDTSLYSYFAILGNEGGANALANGQLISLALGFTNITDMRFQ